MKQFPDFLNGIGACGETEQKKNHDVIFIINLPFTLEPLENSLYVKWFHFNN